nr:hypothetical protein [candidate division Zixibacteria bacterium]
MRWVLIVAVAMIGIYLHVHDLDSDPPLYFTGHGQSLSTDPYHYSYFARNKILFDQWEIFDSARWRMFEVTLVSTLSYLAFSILGISRWSANLLGLILSLSAILVFLLALRRWLDARGLLLVIVLLLFDKVIYVFGRLPYTENGMIFILCLAFYIFQYYRESLSGRIILGILIALAALAGKILALVVIFPVIVSLWVQPGGHKIKEIGQVILSCGLVIILWVVFVYGGNPSRLFGFYQSHMVGLYGFPDAFQSPKALIERLISFGNDARFYFHAPVLGGAVFLSIMIIIYSDFRRILREHVPLLFLIIWFVAGWLVFMPENYRPLRYIYMLYFPLAGIVGYVYSQIQPTPSQTRSRPDWLKRLIFMIIIWVVIQQTWFNLYRYIEFESIYRRLVWISAPIAVAVSLLEWKFRIFRFLAFKRLKEFIFYAAIILVPINFFLPFINWQKQESFNIKEAGNDLAQIVGDRAVIAGPIAPTLLLENQLKGIIYAVGISDTDPDFCRNLPITHFVIDAEASGAVIQKYPELVAAQEIGAYWIRDTKVVVVRVAGLTGNPEAEQYQPGDYEIGRDFMAVGVYDSALTFMERFIARYPNNKSALKILTELYPLFNQVDKALAAAEKAVGLYPDDFSVWLMRAALYQKLYIATGQTDYRDVARKTYLEVIAKNPYQADEVTSLVNKIDSYRGK